MTDEVKSELLKSVSGHVAGREERKDVQHFSGVSLASLPWLLALEKTFLPFAKHNVLVFPEEKQATRVYNELSDIFAGENHTFEYYPSPGNLPFTYAHADSELEGARAKTLAALLSGRPVTVITSLSAITMRTPAKKLFQESSLEIHAAEQADMNHLITFLSSYGYTRREIVEAPGEFSVKGSLVDIFVPVYFNPVRLDFFGDEVDEIRFFDPLTQKSLEKVDRILLTPRRDLPVTPDLVEENRESILTEISDGKEIPPFLNSESDSGGLWDMYPLLIETGEFHDYLDAQVKFFLWEPAALGERAENLMQERLFLFEKNSEKFLLPPEELFLSPAKVIDEVRENSVGMSLLPVSLNDTNLGFGTAVAGKGRISQVVESLLSDAQGFHNIFIVTASEVQRERIEHILSAYDLSTLNMQYLLGSFREGFSWKGGMLLTEKELFGKNVRTRSISRKTTQVIESFVDLTEGDLIVHVNYGIGRFVRLKRMTVAGVERDFLELEYADKDKLFIPLEQLSLIHRYIGSSETRRLDHLGKKSTWEKTRARAQESVDLLAEELLDLYAKREKARGHTFPIDSSFQEEFEAAFPYEETDHQIAAINEIKKDMESERPMDRLVCGDVGFGKTEVAVRAAFKAVMAGKQVAVLCPTTILAFQHYNTFSERFKGYPISVDYMSRFKTSAEIKQMKQKLDQGKLDVVIGTHALLSETVKYKNLGLLIVDEEQRFGVGHKESIRQLKANIDTLTMTATPIPRTLHMSLVGIRDLSLIETPPRNRRKIETYVVEENNEILRRAIAHEAERGGQVYVLHNQVKTIEAQAGRIRSMNPAWSVGILHGQMAEDEIENILLDFYHHRFDVLVSTTIIESGIDIPNVNTLIVMNSQNFGLSQLYQIKGRVGRADRQAYAYFFYPAGGALGEIAQKRLNTLQDYDELGAGFKIAMKDLEIRGAGNLLGKEQSGEILDIGFELYVQMLQDKVHELRGEESGDFECQLVFPQNYFFPDSYIPDTRQKMEFYKKMASATSLDELISVEKEMTDRFGEPPEQVSSMLLVEELRQYGKKLRLEKIELKEDVFMLTAGKDTSVSTDSLLQLVQKDERFSLHPEQPNIIEVRPRQSAAKGLREMIQILNYLQ